MLSEHIALCPHSGLTPYQTHGNAITIVQMAIFGILHPICSNFQEKFVERERRKASVISPRNYSLWVMAVAQLCSFSLRIFILYCILWYNTRDRNSNSVGRLAISFIFIFPDGREKLQRACQQGEVCSIKSTCTHSSATS